MRWMALVLVAGCAQTPAGVLFKCDANGTCPSGFRCEPMASDRYCVAVGASGGGTAGGSTAGGSTAGGSTAGGSTAGGSTAGGSTAGGTTAGGSTAGGSTAGGSTAGGSTAGGSTAGGSTAGGSTAGGSTTTGGGSTAGGPAGGGSSAGGGAGTGGGSTAGGGVGPGFHARAFPDSAFIAVTNFAVAPDFGPSFATLRSSGTNSVFESWPGDLSDGGMSRTEARSPFRADHLSSRDGTVFVSGSLTFGTVHRFEVKANAPERAFAESWTNGLFTTGPFAARRVLALDSPWPDSVAVLYEPDSPTVLSSANLVRISSTFAADAGATVTAAQGTLFTDDALQFRERMLVLTRCQGNCSAGTLTTQANAVVVTSFTSSTGSNTFNVVDAMRVVGPPNPFSLSFSTRFVGGSTLFFVGRAPGTGNPVRVHARRWSSVTFDAVGDLDATIGFDVVDVRPTPDDESVLVLGTLSQSGAFGGTSLTSTPATGRTVVVIGAKLSSTGTLVVSRAQVFNQPGDQAAVAFAVVPVPGIVPSYQLVIVGNEPGPGATTNGFLWSVPY